MNFKPFCLKSTKRHFQGFCSAKIYLSWGEGLAFKLIGILSAGLLEKLVVFVFVVVDINVIVVVVVVEKDSPTKKTNTLVPGVSNLLVIRTYWNRNVIVAAAVVVVAAAVVVVVAAVVVVVAAVVVVVAAVAVLLWIS